MEQRVGTRCRVYGLASSADGVIRYIGQTTKPLAIRLKQHLKEAFRQRNHRAHWIRALLARGDRLLVVELVENAVLNVTEQQVIAEFRARGAALVNNTDGGQAFLGYKPTPEVRQKMSAAAIARLSRPGERERLGDIARANWADPVVRERLLTAQRRASESPDWRRKQSESHKALWADPAYRDRVAAKIAEAIRRPEVRARIAETLREYTSDPAVLEMLSRRGRLVGRDPKRKRSIARKIGNLWKDETYRANQLAKKQAYWTDERRNEQAARMLGRPTSMRQKLVCSALGRTPENQARQRALLARLRADPEVENRRKEAAAHFTPVRRQKAQAHLQRLRDDPEIENRRKKAATDAMQDPEYKARQSANMKRVWAERKKRNNEPIPDS